MNMITLTINGQIANVRDNAALGFKSDFRTGISELELNTDTLVLVNESCQQIHDWIYGASSPGAMVGIPCTATFGSISVDLMIDLTQKPVFRTLKNKDKEVSVKVFKHQGLINWQKNSVAEFEYLASQGVNFPTFQLPYVIIPKERIGTGLAISITLFSMTQAAIQAIRDTTFLIEESIAAIAGSPALFIAAAAKATAQIIYTAALIVAIIDLTRRLSELIFPNVRYLNVCKVKDLITAHCNYYNYTFSSTLLDSLPGLAIAGVPLQKTNKSTYKFIQNDLTDSFTKGYPTASDTVPSVGQLISAIEIAFNAKTKVNDGLVQLERRDFFSTSTSNGATPFVNVQANGTNEHTLNTDDAWIRYLVTYLTDFTDDHTLDNFEPNDAEYGSKNVNQLTREYNLLSGLVTKEIPFSLGTPKIEYDFIEKLALDVFQIVDSITGLNTSSTITDRIGAMQISQQFYSTTKLVYCDINNKLAVNQFDILRANSLYQNYHYINEIQNNSFAELAAAPLLTNEEIFNDIRGNNYIVIDGEDCEILDITYVPTTSTSLITYRKKDDWAIGKISTFAVNT